MFQRPQQKVVKKKKGGGGGTLQNLDPNKFLSSYQKNKKKCLGFFP